MKFLEFGKKIKEGIPRICLAEGEEAYFRERVAETLRTLCVQNPSLNDARFEGERLKGDQLAAFRDSLYTLPFLSEYRLVRVYGFYPTEREFARFLKGYFEEPCPSTVLLILNEKKTSGADLKKEPNVLYVDCGRESDEIVGKWLNGMLRRSGLEPQRDAVTRMVRYCSNDCARLSREIEKLALLLGKGGKVTPEVVEACISKDIEYKVYELTQAAARRSYAAFIEILHELFRKGYDENAALSSLTAHFRVLCEVTSMSGSDAAVASALGIRPYAVQKNREQAARLGRERVRAYFQGLYALSCGARSGRYTKEGAFFAAIAKIFFA